MPRIPVRVEPYSSPSRQHRHYKNKRDQVLRALGKAAYINGSHFAIMWVSARGDVETYASEALQSRLDEWFVKGGIAEEAKQLVKSQGGVRGGEVKVFEDSEDEGGDGEDQDVFLDGAEESTVDDGVEARKKRPLAPLNTAIANQHFARSRLADTDDLFSTAPKSAPLFPTSTFDENTSRVSTTPRLLTPSLPFTTTSTPLHEITLSSTAARTAFLELRFGQLQQGVCKTVAKAWIKIIEPKKQTRCPYNKGEAGKPDWWPEGVRHKEPDHLMKPERHALLLTILRSPKVRVARLQLATAEVVALIKADKVSLLMDVYRIAREEEKLRDAGEVLEKEVKVEVSTLDGWCREGSEPTSQGRQIARSVTPESSEKRKRSCATASAASAAAAAAAPAAANMVKSNSTSGGVKRRATASLSAESRSKPLPRKTRNSIANLSSDSASLPHQQLYGLGLVAAPLPAAVGMARSHSFSAMPPASFDTSSSENSPWPPAAPAYFEANGLVTPLTAGSSIDPNFAAEFTQPSNGGGGGAGGFYYPHPANGGFGYAPPPPPPAAGGGGGGGGGGGAGEMSAPHALHHGTAFEPNALGLESWSFGQFDLPDLSAYSAAGEASFSLDSSLSSVPRTPSPGPPGQADKAAAAAAAAAAGGAALRLDLSKHSMLHDQRAMHALQHEAYGWLPQQQAGDVGGPLHQHQHQHQPQH